MLIHLRDQQTIRSGKAAGNAIISTIYADKLLAKLVTLLSPHMINTFPEFYFLSPLSIDFPQGIGWENKLGKLNNNFPSHRPPFSDD